jgi:hypothetical protein
MTKVSQIFRFRKNAYSDFFFLLTLECSSFIICARVLCLWCSCSCLCLFSCVCLLGELLLVLTSSVVGPSLVLACLGLLRELLLVLTSSVAAPCAHVFCCCSLCSRLLLLLLLVLTSSVVGPSRAAHCADVFSVSLVGNKADLNAARQVQPALGV